MMVPVLALAASDPVPQVMDWTTDPATGLVHFQLRWHNEDLQAPSNPVTGMVMSQPFGAFVPDYGPIGSLDVPTLAPDSFFDVFYDVALADLPPNPEQRLPGGGPGGAPGLSPGSALAPEQNPPCPPDDHWDGNVDVTWTGGTGGQVNVHYGTLLACPGAGASYIHIPILDCPDPNGVTWQVTGLCPGFSATLVNEDFTPAPPNLLPGWSGWICVTADASVPIGQTCCPQVLFTCPSPPGSGQPGATATIDLCTTTCDWGPKDPVPQVLDWTTDPASGLVHFQVRWHNEDLQMDSNPVTGMVMSQPFGVFQPDFGPIGSFTVPPLAPDSFFDVFYDVALADLPPNPAEQLPGGGPGSVPGLATAPEQNPPCPPDDHWDGNVDVTWTGGTGGQVNVHYGTLLVCPGGGASYIHIPLLDCPDPNGVTWQVTGLCPGDSATLVNEDYTPAPAVLPPGWTGWICVTADAGVPIGQTCCPKLLFTCPSPPGSGQPGTTATIDLCVTTCDWAPTAPDPVPQVLDWTTDPATGLVRFQVRWHNEDPQTNSHPVTGMMMSQPFGVYQPDFGPIGSFNVPTLAPDSFFDVFYDVSLADLPPNPAEQLPGGGPGSTPGLATAPEQNPPCPPDDHWDGNVDVTWTGSSGGQVNVHYGTLLVCPGAGASYIHIPLLDCAAGVTWQVTGLCPGFSATLVNEDYTPAPANLPTGWTGWICLTADASVPIGQTCCALVEFDCAGALATIDLCATACDWAPTAPDPVPQVLDWTTDPATGLVRFQVRWHNEDLQVDSHPVTGMVSSQPFGVFQPDFGPIGSFNVPTLAPDSFFDVFYDVSLANLPPGPSKVLPGGGPGSAPGLATAPELNPPCPPDDHWDGNVDVTWTGAAGGQVNVHYGTLLVCPGAGASYIHIKDMICTDPNGVTWQVTGLCPGDSATLVNEDFTPAPANLPVGWTGWICVTADASVPIGQTCCLEVQFDCGGVPATIQLCATTCDWTPDPVPQVMDWTTDPATGLVRFQVRWHNENLQAASNPVSGMVMSQPFGVFQPDFGPIGAFNVPSLAPDSFFDVFYDVSLGDLPPNPQEVLPGGGPGSAPGLATAPEQNPPCPPDDHWDGNVDVTWTGAAGGQVNVHYGTLLVCPGAGASYIHIPLLDCPDPNGVTWQVTGLCPGFSATLVNEDYTPAPANLPTGWTGWICVTAAGNVPIGQTCCPEVLFDCAGVAAKITLCATTCDWAPTAPDPVPQVLDWTTDPATGLVRFQVRWHNEDRQTNSHPVTGMVMSQPFGVYQADFGPIGSFNVPALAPDSFFDVFYDVSLADLPPNPEEQLPGGGPSAPGVLVPEDNPPCPPDDHWDGNVDVTWTGAAGGQVNVHYGTLLLCPGAGSSYIHIPLLDCTDPNGVTWQVTGLCPGFSATLVNEDLTPAPPNLLPGWSGWICLTADASVPIGSVCCPEVLFDCAGVPAKITLCATACDWSTTDIPPTPGLLGFAIQANPNPMFGSTTLNYLVPRAGEARVEIFDTAGKLIRRLLDGPVDAGPGSVTWNGRDDQGESLPAGVYVARLSINRQTTAKKVLLMR